MNSISFNYEGFEIPFELDSDVMINATEMAKPFKGKTVAHFLENQQTQELINQLSIDIGIPTSELIKVVKGGVPGLQGTWMRRELAIAFAMWLSAKFYSWCIRILDYILTQNVNQGYASRDSEIARLTNIINSQQPQINYYNQVLQNPEPLYSTKQLVKQLGIKVSYKKFTQIMIDNGLVYRDNSDGQIYVTANYSKYNYRVATTKLCSDGKFRAVNKWTEAGKQWIYSLAMGLKLI